MSEPMEPQAETADPNYPAVGAEETTEEAPAGDEGTEALEEELHGEDEAAETSEEAASEDNAAPSEE
jgi:hypothetical protein